MKRIMYFMLLIDNSRSNHHRMEEIIVLANAQIDLIRRLEKKRPENKLYCSLYVFNDSITRVLHFVKPSELKDLEQKDFMAVGGSSVLDVIGLAIQEAKYAMQFLPDYRKAKVKIFAFTDAYDTSSTHYNKEMIADLILRLEKTDRWAFYLIGTSFDAAGRAQKLNFKAANTMLIAQSMFVKFHRMKKLDQKS